MSDFSSNIQVESGGNQFDKSGRPLTSSAGAIGVAQIMPSTAPEAAKLAGVEYNVFDLAFNPEYNKKLGEAYKNKQLETFGDEEKANAAYNAGPGNVQKAIERAKKEGGSWKDYLPEETKSYITKVASAKPKTESTNVFDQMFGTPKVEESTKSTNVFDQMFNTPKVEETAKPTNVFDEMFGTLKQSETPAEPQNPFSTFFSHAIAGIPVAMGSHAAGTAAASLAEESIGVPLAPITGGHSLWAAPFLGYLGGFFAGGYGSHKLERHLLPEQVNQYLDQGAVQNEYSAFAGDLASFGPVAGFSIPELTKKGLYKALALSGAGIGFEAANQMAAGEGYDPIKIGISGIAMPFLAGKPTILGEISTIKSFRDRAKESDESVQDLLKKDIYVPKDVNGLKVIDISKESNKDYANRIGNITETEVDTHKQDMLNDVGPVRLHEDSKGNMTIEVDKAKLQEHFDAPNNDADILMGVDKTKFKTAQDYLDFLVHRASIKAETPYMVWKAQNPTGEQIYNSRRSYYDEVEGLRNAQKALGELDPEDAARLAELEKNGPPKPIIENPERLSPHELKSIIYGSKNVGEAVDRIVSGQFGSDVARSLFRILQKNKYLADAKLIIADVPHPDSAHVPAEYDPNTHELTLFSNIDNFHTASLRIFGHEVLHAGTAQALHDPINAPMVEKFNRFLKDLQNTAEKDDLWKKTMVNGKPQYSGYYGLSDIFELISESFTNKEFQNWLRKRSVVADYIDSKPVSAWDAFKYLIKETLGITDKESRSAFDQVIDLTNELTTQENKYGKWDRNPKVTRFDFEHNSYKNFLNTAAKEAAEVNPFYNLDDINIPDVPNHYDDLPDFLFTLDNGKIADNIRSNLLYDEVTKKFSLTDTIKNKLRLFVEGLHENHIELHSQANDLEQTIKGIKQEISKEYKDRDFNASSLNKAKFDKLIKKNPNSLLPAEKTWLQEHKDWLKTVADRYEQIKAYERDAYDLRQQANQRTTLSPEDQKIYDEVYKPLLLERKQGLQYLMNEGIIPKIELKGDNFPRRLKALSAERQKAIDDKLRARGLLEPEPNLWGRVKNYLAELAGGDQGGFNMDMQRRRGATQERALFVLERKNGRRDVIQVTKSGTIIKWDTQTPSLLARKTNADGSLLFPDGRVKVGDKLLDGTITDGTIQEIEHNSPYEYNKDSLAVLLNAVDEIREQVRVNEGIKRLTQGEMFKKFAVKVEPGTVIPPKWRLPTTVDKIPALAGYAFPNKMAEVIEDFARVREPSLLTNLAGILVKNMMLNPLPHIFNEGMHLYNARGLTGWITPAGIGRFVKYGKEAIDSVLTQDQFYRDTVKLGGALLAPGTRHSALHEALFNKGLKEFSGTPDFKTLASELGRSPGELYNAISQKSNQAMWIVRDSMYIQYLKELMATKGLSHQEAILHAERHLPNYRLPTRVGEKMLGANLGRGLSNVLQNPNISVFSRYHYGMVKSMIETVKDVGALRKGAAGKEEFKEGIDTAAAAVVGLAVMYPLLDMLAQRMTGDPHAKQRRAGPYHFANAIADVAEGSKDPQAVISSVFTFNPALQGLIQLGLDRNLYNGQQIYNPQSSPDVIAADVAKYMLETVPQAGQVIRAGSDPSQQGFGTLGARQLDIESPTAYKYYQSEKRKHMLERMGDKHTAETRAYIRNLFSDTNEED